MTDGRRFCRFTHTADSVSLTSIPEDGFCLSAFVILSPEGDPTRVLLGHIAPGAPWDQLGAFTADRVAAHRHGWMLPASQLIYREGPQAAAERIVREQVGLPGTRLRGPEVFSEVYAPRRFPDARGHWDLHFLFRGTLPAGAPPTSSEWTDLEYLDPRSLAPTAFGRSHGDILALAGYTLAPSE